MSDDETRAWYRKIDAVLATRKRRFGLRPIELLQDAPYFAELIGRDGLPCRVWQNPIQQEFAKALRFSISDTSGLRGLLTETDLYVWQSMNLLHADVEATGITGVRIALRGNQIQVHEETVAFPEHFPWAFVHAEAMDNEDRRTALAAYLDANERLRHVYPDGFTVVWYL